MPRWEWQTATGRKCTVCAGWFSAVQENALTCSGACRSWRSRRLRDGGPVADDRTERDCTECGRLFDAVTARGKVCSNPCKQRGIRRRKREARQHDAVTT